MVINNQGKPRIVRFYDEVSLENQNATVKRVHSIVTSRTDDLCCCFAVDASLPNKKIVYRHYATLYFILIVDDAESELGILDLLQVFVQVLDSVFENVCELDLIYHYEKVNFVLDEMVMAGMVLETNVESILAAVNHGKQLEDAEVSVFPSFVDWSR